MTATVGVLALQGAVAEHRQRLETFDGVRTLRVRTAADLAACDGLVIPGGESTTMWRLATRLGVWDDLARVVRGGLPVFGTCAGMIMVADRVIGAVEGQQTFGGIDMTVERNAFGRQVDSFEADLDVQGVAGAPFRGVFIRAPRVLDVGPRVEVLARTGTSHAPDSIVAVRQGPILATAFHPELTQDTRIHRLFVDIVRGRQ